MSALLGWTLLAFGGTYLWGAAGAAAGATFLLFISRFVFLSATDLRALDSTLLAALFFVAAQLVPLPPAVLDILSPNHHALTTALALAPPAAWRPISIDPPASAHAVLVFGAACLVFVSARGVFHYGGIRTVARAVAFLALLASVLGILQHASGTRLVYWRWAPQTQGPAGFGPFINRNHFAAWGVMALSLSIGYLAARTHARDEMDRFRSFTARLSRHLDMRTAWLIVAIGATMAAVVVSLSRSGLAGAAAALLTARLVVAGRHRSAARAWFVVGGAILLVFAVLWAGPATLVDRWRAADIGQEGRSVIWRESMPIVRHFWLTGTGAGTYGDAMIVYQQTGRDRVHFNQAHNHYLQVLVEGGVLLAALSAAAAALFVRAARARLKQDHTGMIWLRVGATSGLVALAVSSIWETAARMPANALLAAVLAAIVLHDTHHHHHAPSRDRHVGSGVETPRPKQADPLAPESIQALERAVREDE